MMQTISRFDSVDQDEMRRWASLSSGQRVLVMLRARQLALGLMRGRLRKQYPDLSLQAINLKLIEELEQRGRQSVPRF
ncbi:MAG: hypothetical protein U0350_21500 [Caldilineaceae bacterium]